MFFLVLFSRKKIGVKMNLELIKNAKEKINIKISKWSEKNV